MERLETAPEPGYYLKSGMHWTKLTPVFGFAMSTTADIEHATRYATREQALKAKALAEARFGVTEHDVVEVIDQWEQYAADQMYEQGLGVA